MVRTYKINGFIFEFCDQWGPQKLKNDLEPAKRMGRKFWKAYGEWEEMGESDRSKFEISDDEKIKKP